jgi:excisionase family DNA binding protein
LSLGRTTVLTLIHDQHIPVVRIGRAVRVPADAVIGFAREQTETFDG